VKSRITDRFRQEFGSLPEQIKEQTRQAYRQFKENPGQPSLPIYSARIGKTYRAVGQLDGDTIIWFWVGSHAEYDQLLSQL
jgi:mRNA-degrading endonuclease RelE of RelBE toxin-antitoxin system